jgi:hypothetical protein
VISVTGVPRMGRLSPRDAGGATSRTLVVVETLIACLTCITSVAMWTHSIS